MNMATYTYFIMTVICCMTVNTYGQSYDNAADLTRDVLVDYKTHVLPILDQAKPMLVNISTVLFSISDVDLVHGIISLVVRVDSSWFDEKINWDPSNYGNMQSIELNQALVWTPNIALGNPTKFRGLGQDWMNVRYTSDGHAFYGIGDVIESACTFNTRFWPFDKQICDISFVAYNCPMSEIMLKVPESNPITMEYFSPNIEWILEDSEAFSRVRLMMAEAVFRLKLKRQSSYYIMSTIMPLILLLILVPLVFLLPSEAGERVGFSITIMLSVTVFLTVIGDSMPKQSEPMSLMCVYVLVSLTTGILTTIAVILNLAVYHRSDKEPVGSWYRSLVQAASCKRHKRCDKNKVEQLSTNLQATDTIDPDGTSNIKMSYIHGHIDGLKVFVPRDVSDNQHLNNLMTGDGGDEDLTWQCVSEAIDSFLFKMTFGFVIIFTTVFFSYVILASDYDAI